eukprot:TRINITY_DN11940_c0_g1_i1.p1 TRINITY_DN11940_c0_g1~~TRINITY_DN11940_c0_g1_i1.p1  ORF type:complete len:149 (+),score=25.08 TRINITY_DN11940_c0_g1_i1:58-447(+)
MPYERERRWAYGGFNQSKKLYVSDWIDVFNHSSRHGFRRGELLTGLAIYCKEELEYGEERTKDTLLEWSEYESSGGMNSRKRCGVKNKVSRVYDRDIKFEVDFSLSDSSEMEPERWEDCTEDDHIWFWY